MRAAAEAATGYTGTFPGRADQVRRARRAVAHYLHGCPVTDDAVLIVSELCSNAVLHSASKGGFFTVRAEIFPGYLWLEVEDLGGYWNLNPAMPPGRTAWTSSKRSPARTTGE